MHGGKLAAGRVPDQSHADGLRDCPLRGQPPSPAANGVLRGVEAGGSRVDKVSRDPILSAVPTPQELAALAPAGGVQTKGKAAPVVGGE